MKHIQHNNLFYQFQAIFTSRVSSENHSVGYSLSSTLASCFDDMQLWNRTAGIGRYRVIMEKKEKLREEKRREEKKWEEKTRHVKLRQEKRRQDKRKKEKKWEEERMRNSVCESFIYSQIHSFILSLFFFLSSLHSFPPVTHIGH